MITKEFITVKLDELHPYENNPRINDNAVSHVKASIEQCENLDPIEIDENGVILSGHTRLLALQELGYTETEVVRISGLDEDQKRKYRILANKTNEIADWDFDKLAEELDGLDFDGFDFGFENLDADIGDEDGKAQSQEDKSGNVLQSKFIVPPFSILDSRQGYWQNRKKAWRDIGIISEKGRAENLLGTGLAQLANDYCSGSKQLQGTSIFDPVLCEIMYKWFNVQGGSVYDCFAGGSVRGIVAEKLGYKYTGIDLRQEQIDANNQAAQQIGIFPKWYCDDSLNADKYVQDNSCDMIFTCPPYADLEVYSDDERDISNMSYDDFCNVYSQILSIAIRKLKQDRFAVVVIGDVRDKQGAYRMLVDFTKDVLKQNSLCLYNEFILVESVGTAALRAAKQFNALRKAVKTHQNVLVFYKGNIKNIKNNFPKLNLSESDIMANINE